jgi:plastocyanin
MSPFPSSLPSTQSASVYRRVLSWRAVRRAPMFSLALMPIVFGAVDAHAKVSYVIVGGTSLTFSPPTVDIDVGDTVTFLNFGGLHNVVADDGSFRCAQGCDGHGGSGAASSQLWSVSIDFPQTGTIGYFCEIHGMPGAGMFGTINVIAAPPPPPPPPSTSAVSIGGKWFLALLGAALAACAMPWLCRARRVGNRSPRD